MLSHDEMLKLKRWNTPTIYNGWEAIAKRDRLEVLCNREEVRDYMEYAGPMIGRAVTVVVDPSDTSALEHKKAHLLAYRKYVASVPGPKIVIVKDLGSPDRIIGSFWGEVNANIHKALGCVGTITDGAIRDVDEMRNAGFKALARRMCVGHAYSMPLQWGVDVEIFGCPVKSRDLIHADKHGFIIIPEEDQKELLASVLFMDANECETLIPTARNATGKSLEQILQELSEAEEHFTLAKRAH
jgi:regulator of RNase E activity RraA